MQLTTLIQTFFIFQHDKELVRNFKITLKLQQLRNLSLIWNDPGPINRQPIDVSFAFLLGFMVRIFLLGQRHNLDILPSN